MKNTAMDFKEMARLILSETIELDQEIHDLTNQALLNAQYQYTNYMGAVEAINQTGIGETLELVRWALIDSHTDMEASQLEPVAMANMALQSAIRDYVDIVLHDTCRVNKDGLRVTTALTRNTVNKLA